MLNPGALLGNIQMGLVRNICGENSDRFIGSIHPLPQHTMRRIYVITENHSTNIGVLPPLKKTPLVAKSSNDGLIYDCEKRNAGLLARCTPSLGTQYDA